MFERRFADKLTYMEWKLGFMAEERDFEFIVDNKKSPKDIKLTAELHAKKHD